MLARKRVPTRSSSAMVDLLSRKMLSRTGELASELPTTSEDAVESNKQRDGQKSTAGEAMSSVAVAVSVVPVRAEVRAMEAIRVPERPEDKAEDQRDCDEDEDGWTTIRVSIVFSRFNCVERDPAH
jgi:hypothetical protein